MNKFKACVCAAVTLMLTFATLNNAFAIPAAPGVRGVKMSDGSIMQVRLIGDERISWFETLDGYTVVKNAQGDFEYATVGGNGELASSGARIGSGALPAQKHIRPSQDVIASRTKSSRFAPRKVSNITGSEKVLVLLIEFVDVEHSASHTTSYFNSLYFGSSFGDLKNYVEAISYNNLTLTGAASSQWFQSSKMMGYYGYTQDPNLFRAEQLVIEAIDAADPSIDFSDYDQDGDGYVDHLIIVHAGDDAAAVYTPTNEIWSHRGEISSDYETNDGTKVKGYVMNSEENYMGIFAHELMHDIGAPDLYDYDYDGNPIGYWCIMDYGAYGGSPAGSVPVQLCGYLKSDIDADPNNGNAGWLGVETLSASGAQTITQLTNNTGNRLYKVYVPNDNEYFLIENREFVGYDESLPDEGIVIYHVDEDMPDGYGWTINDGTPSSSFYRIAVEDECGDGYSCEKGESAFSEEDSQTTFNKTSIPNSKSNNGRDSGVAITDVSNSGSTMTFTLTLSEAVANVPPTVSVSASPTTGSAPLTVIFTGTATDSDGEIVAYHYDFGDNTSNVSKSPQHEYDEAGEYTVTFSATDNEGASSTAQVVITVAEGGGGGGNGCMSIKHGSNNIKPPTTGQAIVDLLLFMIPAFFIYGKKVYGKKAYNVYNK